jgi:acetyl esterase/lipase
MKNVSYGPHSTQVLNFWQAESEKPTPLLFMIHGGGWKGGAKDEVLTSDYWLKNGVSVVSIDYRGSVEAILPAPVMDAARALQFVRYKAKEWNVDKDRIALTGGSAGGATSLWLSFHDDLADPDNADPVLRESTKPMCALTTNGQTSVDPVWVRENVGESASRHYMVWMSVGAPDPKDLNKNPDKYISLARHFSPIRFLDKKDPPVGLALSFPMSDKGIHSPWFGIRLKEKADEIGADVTLFCKDKHELGNSFNEKNGFLQQFLLD